MERAEYPFSEYLVLVKLFQDRCVDELGLDDVRPLGKFKKRLAALAKHFYQLLRYPFGQWVLHLLRLEAPPKLPGLRKQVIGVRVETPND